MSADPKLRAIADAYWEDRLRFSPLFATFLGDHRYDGQVDDLSAAAEQTHRERWVSHRAALEELDERDLDETDQVTRQLLAGELDDAVTSIDLRLAELQANQMLGIHAELLSMAGQLSAPEPDHAALAVDRIRVLGTMLDAAAERYRAGLAAGRTPARVAVERSLSQIDGYLASPVAGDPFVQMGGPDGNWDGTEAWRAELADAVAEHLRPAYQRHRTVFAEELQPRARADDRAGLCWLDEGTELYQTLIGLHTGLDLEAGDLHEIGHREASVELPEQFREIGSAAFGTDDLTEIFDRLLNDPSLRYGSGDEIVDHAQRCLDEANGALDGWFDLVPEAPCELTPVPEFLAADAPAAYYTPPAPGDGRPGEYHVNLHEPTERSRAETASIAFHEAIPGHHLQLAIASERAELPAFRRLSWGHTAYVEGWALYAERLADEMGLYATDIDRLGMLAADAWRACRLVVDTGLHADGWSRARAVEYMVDHAPVPRAEIETEIDRYLAMPGQALAYKVGQREILSLRAEASGRLGDRFTIAGFHDVVLGAATVSLDVLGRRVRSWSP